MKRNKKKMVESNLDEMQELKLLHIEHNACWMAFWGLLLCLLIQPILFGFDAKNLAGEWLVFMCLSIYMSIDCARNGIWDRRLKMNTSVIIGSSVIAGAVVGIFNFIIIFQKHPTKIVGSIAAGAFMAILTFGITFVILEITSALIKKRRQELEAEPEPELEAELKEHSKM